MSKVIHVSDELHRQAKCFAESKGLSLKEWAEKVLVDEMTDTRKPPTSLSGPERVQKKQFQTFKEERSDELKPWQLPPFWERRGPKKSRTTEEEKVARERERIDREELSGFLSGMGSNGDIPATADAGDGGRDTRSEEDKLIPSGVGEGVQASGVDQER